MAFAFSQIDELLKGEGQENQSNIFGGAPGGAPQDQQGGDLAPKTVAEGGAGQSGAMNPNASSGGSGGSQDTAAADRAAFKANAGKVAAPKTLSDVQNRLKANEDKLQSEANAYAESQKAKQNYGFTDDVLSSAVGPKRDETAFSNISSLLGRKNLNEIDSFKAPDVSVEDLDLFNTNAGQRQLVSRGQDPSYTSGMASFDVRALQKSQGFNEAVKAAKSRQAKLQAEADAKGEALRGEVETYGQSQLTEAQKRARDFYANQSKALADANALEAQAYNDSVAALDVNKLGGDALTVAAEKAKAGLSNPREQRFIDPKAVDASKFVTRGPSRTAADFVSADEAARYNNILSLLGAGDQSWAESLPIQEAGSAYNVDYAGLEDALKQGAQSGYKKFEGDSLSSIKEIMDSYQKKADERDVAYKALADAQATPDWLLSEAEKVRQGIDPALRGYYSERVLDPVQYANKVDPIDLNWQDVISQEDADRLNALNEGIGVDQRVGAGAGFGTDPYAFNKEGYLKDLIAALTAQRDAPVPVAAAPTVSSPSKQSAMDKFDPTKGETILPAVEEGVRKAGTGVVDYVKDNAKNIQDSLDAFADATKSSATTGNMIYDTVHRVADPIVIPTKKLLAKTGIPQAAQKAGNDISSGFKSIFGMTKKKKNSAPAKSAAGEAVQRGSVPIDFIPEEVKQKMPAYKTTSAKTNTSRRQEL